MFSTVFLAMTAREMEEFSPPQAAYMACHFSSWGTGLSNLPSTLPENSLLLVDDSMPIDNHDPDTVIRQLLEMNDRFSIKGVLLDFQNKRTEQAENMARRIIGSLPCPTAATESYAKRLHCPVLLSPAPVNISVQNHLAPWLEQGVYLEIAPEALQITVTEAGSTMTHLPVCSAQKLPLHDPKLHCHYQVAVSDKKAIFTLTRDKDDLNKMVQQAYTMGILGAVGLYQELHRL